MISGAIGSLRNCPAHPDVHSGWVARALGPLERRANDARAVSELDQALRRLDPVDTVRFDYALFGLGVLEQFCAGKSPAFFKW